MSENNFNHTFLQAQSSSQLEDASSFLDAASEAMHIVSAQGIIIWANQKELDLLGYSAEEYIGHHISEFYADLFSINDVLCRLIYNQEVLNYPAELKRKDGSTVSVLLSSNIYVKNGKFVHTRCFTRDISDLKTIQARMQISNAKILNQLFSSNSLIESIASTSWKTNFEGKIKKIQLKWMEYTGQILAEQLDYGWINAFHRDDRLKIKENLHEAIKENREFRQLTRVFNVRHNTYLYCGLYAIPYVALHEKTNEWTYILVDQAKTISPENLPF